MNTLCLYYENAAARRIAVMIGSILSMSRYAECREDVSLRQYKRILLVLTEKQAVQPLAEVVQHAEPDTIWGLIVIGDNELSVQRLRRQAEMLLKRPIALSAFIPASDVTEGVIRAAETIQPPPAAVPDSDSTAWQALETFLTSHTTGVLATGWGRNIRTTPIEYVYWHKKIYLFSEGGRKFANIYRDPHVSFSVCEPFSDFSHLAGLQLSGTAQILEPQDEGYTAAAAAKGIAEERLRKMPVVLHVIEISPSEAVFLWGQFAREGKAVRQVYRF